MTDLAGRHALITGGGTGIGAAIAKALAGAGARLSLVGRRAEPLAAVASRLDQARAITGDVTDAESFARAHEEAVSGFGPVDILIANAGAAESAPFERTDAAMWQRLIAVNLTGVYLSVGVVLPAMREAGRGRIIAVASTAGLKGYAYVAAYCAAKHGVIGLIRALAVETAREGITVNAVCPGYTETPMLERSVAEITQKTGRSADDARRALSAANPQGRLVTPDEVAASVLWLCGDAASAMTGQAIAVAGGEVM